MANYGLIGKSLDYSFSEEYFKNKFEEEKRQDSYRNIEVDTPQLLEKFLEKNKHSYKGFNVTIPYKETIIPFLDRVDNEAKAIGAVNTIKVNQHHKLIGYNTDHYGFALTLIDFLPLKEKTALILGTGGASKAIAYVLETMDFEYKYVSRNGIGDIYTYENLTEQVIKSHFLIINCTPVGTFPDTKSCPNLPYQYLNKEHVLIDLIYNPEKTEFLKRGFVRGARVSNGLKMLENQAKKSWSIWQK